MKSHHCLTEDAVLRLLALPLPPPQPGVVFCALECLTSCEGCWKAIKRLRNNPPYPPMPKSPFATVFYTLISRRVRRASHRTALCTVRSAPLGGYRLLLEEIADLLSTHETADNQQSFLLFDLLLQDLKDGSPHWHDLVARFSVVQSLFWSRNGNAGRAKEELRKASYHRGLGTGDGELHATLLATEGEVLHAVEPGRAMGKTVRALNLVVDLPLRKLELLWQLASLHLHQQEFAEAWQVLLDVEDLADSNAHYFLESIWFRMLEVETGLLQCGDEVKRTLYHCFVHYHARCLGFTVDGTIPPGLSRLQHPPRQLVASRLESLCLCWSAGLQICESDFRDLQQLILSVSGREFLEELYDQLTEIWVRYPDGRLASDLLEPLVGRLDELRLPV